MIINSVHVVMRLLALVALTYFTQHSLVARISSIARINQLGEYGSVNWVNIYQQYLLIFIDMIHCNISFYEATNNLPVFWKLFIATIRGFAFHLNYIFFFIIHITIYTAYMLNIIL